MQFDASGNFQSINLSGKKTRTQLVFKKKLRPCLSCRIPMPLGCHPVPSPELFKHLLFRQSVRQKAEHFRYRDTHSSNARLAPHLSQSNRDAVKELHRLPPPPIHLSHYIKSLRNHEVVKRTRKLNERARFRAGLSEPGCPQPGSEKHEIRNNSAKSRTII